MNQIYILFIYLNLEFIFIFNWNSIANHNELEGSIPDSFSNLFLIKLFFFLFTTQFLNYKF